MKVGSTDILRLLAAKDGRYLAFEPSIPHGTLKRPMLSLREANGRAVGIGDQRGIALLDDLPLELRDDFLRQSYVWDDGHDGDGRIIYRPTADALERGRKIPVA